MNKPKIPRETTLVTVGISCSQWGSLLQGGQNTSYKVDATELFFFFPNKSGTFVKSSSLPSRRSFRHAIFPSIPWRGKGDCVTGQKRLPSRVTRTSRSRALGESLLSVFQGWYINFILFYFIFKFFFLFIYLLFAARSSHYFSSRVPHILRKQSSTLFLQPVFAVWLIFWGLTGRMMPRLSRSRINMDIYM